MSNLIYLLRHLNKLMNFWSHPKGYSKSNQTSKMKIFGRIVLFSQKTLSLTFHWVLDTPLHSVLYPKLLTINLLIDKHLSILRHMRFASKGLLRCLAMGFIDLISNCSDSIFKIKTKKNKIKSYFILVFQENDLKIHCFC